MDNSGKPSGNEAGPSNYRTQRPDEIDPREGKRVLHDPPPYFSGPYQYLPSEDYGYGVNYRAAPQVSTSLVTNDPSLQIPASGIRTPSRSLVNPPYSAPKHEQAGTASVPTGEGRFQVNDDMEQQEHAIHQSQPAVGSQGRGNSSRARPQTGSGGGTKKGGSGQKSAQVRKRQFTEDDLYVLIDYWKTNYEQYRISNKKSFASKTANELNRTYYTKNGSLVKASPEQIEKKLDYWVRRYKTVSDLFKESGFGLNDGDPDTIRAQADKKLRFFWELHSFLGDRANVNPPYLLQTERRSGDNALRIDRDYRKLQPRQERGSKGNSRGGGARAGASDWTRKLYDPQERKRVYSEFHRSNARELGDETCPPNVAVAGAGPSSAPGVGPGLGPQRVYESGNKTQQDDTVFMMPPPRTRRRHNTTDGSRQRDEIQVGGLTNRPSSAVQGRFGADVDLTALGSSGTHAQPQLSRDGGQSAVPRTNFVAAPRTEVVAAPINEVVEVPVTVVAGSQLPQANAEQCRALALLPGNPTTAPAGRSHRVVEMAGRAHRALEIAGLGLGTTGNSGHGAENAPQNAVSIMGAQSLQTSSQARPPSSAAMDIGPSGIGSESDGRRTSGSRVPFLNQMYSNEHGFKDTYQEITAKADKVFDRSSALKSKELTLLERTAKMQEEENNRRAQSQNISAAKARREAIYEDAEQLRKQAETYARINQHEKALECMQEADNLTKMARDIRM